jgi:hypothetical protein
MDGNMTEMKISKCTCSYKDSRLFPEPCAKIPRIAQGQYGNGNYQTKSDTMSFK